MGRGEAESVSGTLKENDTPLFEERQKRHPTSYDKKENETALRGRIAGSQHRPPWQKTGEEKEGGEAGART